MSMSATSEMCYFCFDMVLDYFRPKNDSDDDENEETHKHTSTSLSLIPNNDCALFVTWKTRKSKELRGCIGTHGTLPLHDGLKRYAIYSAFKDRRFEPITVDELPKLSCTVSLLFDFEPISDCFDWIVGEHGIKIEFHDSRNIRRSATYLPEVAQEQGWDQRQTLKHLVKKSGCTDHPIIDDKGRINIANLVTVRYRSSKTTSHFQQYFQSRGKSFFTKTPLAAIVSDLST
eukprot:TRINITY_DN16899_c0_g1_i1.p1 TRINITY_DN16899_c0_g1~~TRINITY_DN16899_c0_g1_i1.p1  ORF type:complete len:231 (+),score=31.26 TRINITY_DN16899_c0_g1_i1:70-762(+)